LHFSLFVAKFKSSVTIGIGNMRKSLRVLALLAGTVFASASANAVVLPTIVGPNPTGTYFDTTFNSSGGATSISFDVIGYRSLDGVNDYQDTFHLWLNGFSNEIFTGSYNLGGGGVNTTFIDLIGSTITGLDPNPNHIGFTGGVINISGIFNALVGVNTLSFGYSDNGFQGTGDEAWGVDNINVSAVPVPPAALLLGTGLIGLASLRRKAKKA
jgi:hypothetical protein